MPPNKHAALGASSSHRWMECPGSIRLSQEVPKQPPSEHAIEGSAAHALAEMALTDGQDAEQYVGDAVTVGQGVNEEHVIVTDGMARAVQVYLDHVRAQVNPSVDLVVEARFSLEALDPPAPMFGTADAVVWNEETRTLDVMDYKHGRGVVVEVEDNPQLLYYALGAVLDLRVEPDTIRVTIVQPRAHHKDGPIRSWGFGWDRLVEFKENLMEAAEEAAAPDAPVGPVGDHCRWCPAKAICPAQAENALTVAESAFVAKNDPENDVQLPSPEVLSETEMLEVLDVAPMVEDWFKAIRSYVKEKLEKGEDVPGWKLVEKRATRRWADAEEAEEWLRSRFKVGEIFKKKLVSPYQAEQLLKDRPRTELPDDFIVRRVRGFNMVSEDNPKPAVTPALKAAEEFEADDQ